MKLQIACVERSMLTLIKSVEDDGGDGQIGLEGCSEVWAGHFFTLSAHPIRDSLKVLKEPLPR